MLLIFFGHSPKYGYVNHVQEFHLGEKTWTIPKVSGAVVKGKRIMMVMMMVLVMVVVVKMMMTGQVGWEGRYGKAGDS